MVLTIFSININLYLMEKKKISFAVKETKDTTIPKEKKKISFDVKNDIPPQKRKKKSFDIKNTLPQEKINRRVEKSKTCILNQTPINLIPIINSSSITFQNPKHRDTMEDRIYTCHNYMGESNKKLFIVFDGHGGDSCVELALERFPEIFRKYLKDLEMNVDYCLKKSFLMLDREIKEMKCQDGTTLTCVYINNNNLYCANVGDSSCYLVTSNHAEKISYDHTCIDESEAKRVTAAGGRIFEERIDGIIAISRTIGDHELKGKGLICDPYLYKRTIEENDKYFIMASDGVWDVLQKDDIYKICKTIKKPDLIAQKILQTSVNKGTTDNVCCIVVSLNNGFA